MIIYKVYEMSSTQELVEIHNINIATKWLCGSRLKINNKCTCKGGCVADMRHVHQSDEGSCWWV